MVAGSGHFGDLYLNAQILVKRSKTNYHLSLISMALMASQWAFGQTEASEKGLQQQP
jgi:hypothetical protein